MCQFKPATHYFFFKVTALLLLLNSTAAATYNLLTGHDNELGDTSVKSLGSFVSTLLELLVVGCLLNKIQNGVGQASISERESLGVHGGRLWTQ